MEKKFQGKGFTGATESPAVVGLRVRPETVCRHHVGIAASPASPAVASHRERKWFLGLTKPLTDSEMEEPTPPCALESLIWKHTGQKSSLILPFELGKTRAVFLKYR